MAEQLQIELSCDSFSSAHCVGPSQCRSFCSCALSGKGADCRCGEDQVHLDWTWDLTSTTSDVHLQHEGKEVIFHPNYSSGTAAIRSTEILPEGQHYWEVKMSTPVYGTDMMVGVGTSEAKLNHLANKFDSLLGEDEESWGLSYQGTIHHSGVKERYTAYRVIGQGSIIGLYLDTWLGHLSFYLNRQPLGVAFDGLRQKQLFPIVSSTAARSGMKVITTHSHETSLFFLCAKTLRKYVPHDKHVADTLPLPPGLALKLRQKLDWLLRPHPDPYPERQAMKSYHACSKCNNSASCYFGAVCQHGVESALTEGATGEQAPDGGRPSNLDDDSPDQTVFGQNRCEMWVDRKRTGFRGMGSMGMSTRVRCSSLPRLTQSYTLPGRFTQESGPGRWSQELSSPGNVVGERIPIVNTQQLLRQLVQPSCSSSSSLDYEFCSQRGEPNQDSRSAVVQAPVDGMAAEQDSSASTRKRRRMDNHDMTEEKEEKSSDAENTRIEGDNLLGENDSKENISKRSRLNSS